VLPAFALPGVHSSLLLKLAYPVYTVNQACHPGCHKQQARVSSSENYRVLYLRHASKQKDWALPVLMRDKESSEVCP
jgi:hypothetical protein